MCIRDRADAAPGDYHLMVWCTDAAGNQTEVARNIVLSADGGTETVSYTHLIACRYRSRQE